MVLKNQTLVTARGGLEAEMDFRLSSTNLYYDISAGGRFFLGGKSLVPIYGPITRVGI